MIATATLAVGLTVGIATPSDALTKHGTTVTLSSIKHVATKQNKGSTIVSGDKVDLKGRTSSNLVGKTLTVEVKDGFGWESHSGSGKVSHRKTFSIRIKIDQLPGQNSYRVVFSGTSSLNPSSGSKSATIWAWTPLVEVPVSSTDGSSDVNAAAHPQTNLVVKKKNYATLLAGTVPTGGTGAAHFDIGKHCRSFTSLLGLTDDSPSQASIAYSVYFGDVAEIAPTLAYGKTKQVTLSTSGVSDLVLRNTEPDPNNLFTGPTYAAWPNAQVLCNATF